MRAGGVWPFPCPDIHPTIRFKPLDLLRPTSNRTPLTRSKYRFKSRSFLKCLLRPQHPSMVQPPPKFLPIYYHKRVPWNMLGGSLLVRGAKCFCCGTSRWSLLRSLFSAFREFYLHFCTPSPQNLSNPSWSSFLALFLLLVFISLILQNESRA